MIFHIQCERFPLEIFCGYAGREKKKVQLMADANFLAIVNPTEIVLDYLIERKREDDLYASIIDGRYEEQKVFTTYLM